MDIIPRESMMQARDILTSDYVTNYNGPLLLIDPAIVSERVRRFTAAMPRVEVNYAIKSNPHPAIMRAVHEGGGSFDVASLQEVQQVLDLGDADISKVVYSNPIRPPRYLKQADAVGVKWFVVDSLHELIKVQRNVVDPQVYIRLTVPNDNARFPLVGKFGISAKDAEELIDYCADHKIALRGVSFHVGSQCTSADGWVKGIKIAKQVFHYMQYKGIEPDFLNLGGGFPASYVEQAPSIEELGEKINAELADLPDTFRIVAEPGRYVCAEACHLLAQAISVTTREGLMWVYLDTGVFHGIIEASMNDFAYQMETVSTKLHIPCAFAGPTCDSSDIVTRKGHIAHDFADGDFVVFKNAGAYSTGYTTEFNGFPALRAVLP
jgi:ornithine decarboxylase